MQELINKLQAEHGLSHEQSHGILNTITSFIKEKFPMVGGAIDNLFPHDGNTASTVGDTNAAGDTTVGDTGSTDEPTSKGGSFLDNISDYIPGATGEKIEGFAKDKLGGMFGNDKKPV
jgi:hypothetical protein